jgi:branched-chain amino acid transport system substrate-binding protein
MPDGQHWSGWYWYTAFDNGVNDEFVGAYEEENQGGELVPVPTFTGGSSYIAPLIYKQAMEAAGGTNPDDVIAEMEGLSIDAPMGEITLDPDSHQASSPTCLGTTTKDADVPYDGATLTDLQTYTLDRDTALDLLEGSDLPPGV